MNCMITRIGFGDPIFICEHRSRAWVYEDMHPYYPSKELLEDCVW